MCLVKITPMKPLALEPFADCPPLGRFVIQDGHLTVAVGVVKSVEPAAAATPGIKATPKHLKAKKDKKSKR